LTSPATTNHTPRDTLKPLKSARDRNATMQPHSRFHLSPLLLSLLVLLLPSTLAAPAPTANQVAVPHPMITPPPSLTDRTPSRVYDRDLISSIKGLPSYLSSVLGTYPSYIASGVPNFFQDFPTGSAVESTLGISDSDLAATPTQVLNIP